MANQKISAMAEVPYGAYRTDQLPIVRSGNGTNFSCHPGDITCVPPSAYSITLNGTGSKSAGMDYNTVIALTTHGTGANEIFTIRKPTNTAGSLGAPWLNGERVTVYLQHQVNGADTVQVHPGGAGITGVYVTGTNDPTQVYTSVNTNKLATQGDVLVFEWDYDHFVLCADATHLSAGLTLSNAKGGGKLKGWANLPTADPHVAGTLWRSGTALQVSVG